MIDWLISHQPARAFEGVSGRGLRRSQQRGRVLVAVSYTYLGGGMQPLGCRRLHVNFNLRVVLRFPVYVIRVARARLQAGGAPFFFSPSGSCMVQCRRWCDVGLLPCFANMHACLHAGGAFILPRMEFALCCADVV